MQQIINFIVKNKNGFTFLLLFGLSIFLIINTHTYQKSKFLNFANQINGSFYSLKSSVNDYFQLKKENEILWDENQRIRNEIMNLKTYDSLNEDAQFISQSDTLFHFYKSKIISNNYRKNFNFLLLNKGTNDSIKVDMCVISPNGVVGIVEGVSQNYARVISLLNKNLSINAEIKKTNHFGSLRWEGNSPYYSTLLDIPRSAKPKEGDTIVTGGNSLIFPKGIKIGYIENYQLNQNTGYYNIKVKLSNDFTSLSKVYVLDNDHLKEASKLLNQQEYDQ